MPNEARSQPVLETRRRPRKSCFHSRRWNRESCKCMSSSFLARFGVEKELLPLAALQSDELQFVRTNLVPIPFRSHFRLPRCNCAICNLYITFSRPVLDPRRSCFRWLRCSWADSYEYDSYALYAAPNRGSRFRWPRPCSTYGPHVAHSWPVSEPSRSCMRWPRCN